MTVSDTDSESGGGAGRMDGESFGAATRLRQAVERNTQTSGGRHELEAAARELVRELRRSNQLPEQVLLHIKRVLADAGLRPTYGGADPAGDDAGRNTSLYRDVIAWSIRYYYDDDTPPNGDLDA